MGNMISCCSKKSEDFSDKNSQKSTVGNKSSPGDNKNFSKNYPINKFVQYYKEDKPTNIMNNHKEKQNGGNTNPQSCPSKNLINRDSFLIQDSIKIDPNNKASKISTDQKRSCCDHKVLQNQERKSKIIPIVQTEETVISNDNKEILEGKSGSICNEKLDKFELNSPLEKVIPPVENGRKSTDSDPQKEEQKNLIDNKVPEKILYISPYKSYESEKEIVETNVNNNKQIDSNNICSQATSDNLENTAQTILDSKKKDEEVEVSKLKDIPSNENKQEEILENRLNNSTEAFLRIDNEKVESNLKESNNCCNKKEEEENKQIEVKENAFSLRAVNSSQIILIDNKESQEGFNLNQYEKKENIYKEQIYESNNIEEKEKNQENYLNDFDKNNINNQSESQQTNSTQQINQINEDKIKFTEPNLSEHLQMPSQSLNPSENLKDSSDNILLVDKTSQIINNHSHHENKVIPIINNENCEEKKENALEKDKIIENSQEITGILNQGYFEQHNFQQKNDLETSKKPDVDKFAGSLEINSNEVDSLKNLKTNIETKCTEFNNTDKLQHLEIIDKSQNHEELPENNGNNITDKSETENKEFTHLKKDILHNENTRIQEEIMSIIPERLNENEIFNTTLQCKPEGTGKLSFSNSQNEFSNPSFISKPLESTNNKEVKEFQIDTQINDKIESMNQSTIQPKYDNLFTIQNTSHETRKSVNETFSEDVRNNDSNEGKIESSSSKNLNETKGESINLKDDENNTNEAFDFTFNNQSGKQARKTVTIKPTDRQKINMLMNENQQPNTNHKFLPEESQVNLGEDKGGQMMEKRKKLVDSSLYAVKYTAPEVTEKKEINLDNNTPQKLVSSSSSSKNNKSAFVTQKVDIPVQTSEFEYSEPRKRMTVTGFSKPIITEEYKPSRRHTVVNKSHQKSLIKNTVKPEKFLENFKHKINLSVFLEENKIQDDLSLSVYSNENKENSLLGETFYQKGVQSGDNLQFSFDFSFEIVQNILIKIISENENYEYTFTLGQILTNNNNQLSVKNENFTLVLKANVIKNDEKELFSVFSVRYAYKIISMQPKVVSYKMWRYKENCVDGDLLYESEEQSSQKIFQFCDALINKEMVSNKNDLFCIEIYEKENMIGKTKSLDLKLLTTSKKGIEIYDNKNKEVGTKLDVQYSERKSKNFIDYLSNGVSLNYMIAIDFTSSNSDYVKKESLHNIDTEQLNIYESLILDIGKIIQSYDKTHEHSVYGYGGIPPEKDAVSHCFFVNLKNEPTIIGLNCILENYRSTLPKLRFLGPTYFRYFVKSMIEKVKKSQSNKEQVYFISLILTDGQINDMEETIDLFVEASKLPISFIIVGVGNENFNDMYILDRNKHSLINNKGEKALRDAVHFVVYNDFLNFQVFAEACLKEIPYQIEEYYRFQTVNLN